MNTSSQKFRFKKTDNIGAPGAEEDSEFLENCFVDTGDLGLLNSSTDHRLIVLGRTGAGKTALLKQLQHQTDSRVIEINPDNLALTYIANSRVLNFFDALKINLDPFYKLLWRHVLTVEILTKYFMQHPQREESASFLDRLRSFFSGNSRDSAESQQSIKYLEEWGKHFWLETEYRVKEITLKIEEDLLASLKASLGYDALGIEGRAIA